MEENSGQKWTMEVKSKTEWFDLNLKEVWQYKDLVYMMVTRDFISQFKQTILGPMWYIFQPLITTIVYSIVFGSIAKISTDEIPHTLFYMSGLLFWNMFASYKCKIIAIIPPLTPRKALNQPTKYRT